MLTQVRVLYCAAFIMAKGVRLDHMEPAGGGYVNFFFPARECGPFLTEWYEPNATVNAHDYLGALKQLRSITNGQGRGVQ